MKLQCLHSIGHAACKNQGGFTSMGKANPMNLIPVDGPFQKKALKSIKCKMLSSSVQGSFPATPYNKGMHLFSFHSWRPVIIDPEYGYTF